MVQSLSNRESLFESLYRAPLTLCVMLGKCNEVNAYSLDASSAYSRCLAFGLLAGLFAGLLVGLLAGVKR